MVALGFEKAPNWDNDTLAQRLKLTPSRVKSKDVPEAQQGLYQELSGMDEKETVEITEPTEAVQDESDTKPAKKSAKPAKEAAPAKPAKKEATPAKKAAAPAAPAKPMKPAPKQRRGTPADKDKFGCRQGTISAKVNAAIGAGWKTDKEIAEAAGLDLAEARGRLYLGTVQGIFESKRIIQYRITPKA